MIQLKKGKYLIAIFVLLCICFIAACINNYLLFSKNSTLKNNLSELQTRVNDKEDEIKQLKENEEILKRTYSDTNYKLFFGEWVVTRILAENYRFGAEENAKELIGTIFYYDFNLIKQNNKITSDMPIYQYHVIPKNNKRFLPYMPLPSQLGIEGEFSLFVETKTKNISTKGTSFYVKDDKTLILFENGAFYEMKRKGYKEENISENYEHI